MFSPKIITCYTTVSSKVISESLIKQLLEFNLIACGVTWSAQSQYQWNDENTLEEEYVVYLKSSLELKDDLMSRLNDLHPYDVPCILVQEVECNQAYYNWVEKQTRPESA